jgi:hypothetical protein
LLNPPLKHMDGAKPSGKDKRFFLAKQLLNVGIADATVRLLERGGTDRVQHRPDLGVLAALHGVAAPTFLTHIVSSCTDGVVHIHTIIMTDRAKPAFILGSGTAPVGVLPLVAIIGAW